MGVRKAHEGEVAQRLRLENPKLLLTMLILYTSILGGRSMLGEDYERVLSEVGEYPPIVMQKRAPTLSCAHKWTRR